MDDKRIKTAAIVLKELLEKYAATNQDVRNLLSGMRDLIERAIACDIQRPLEWHDIPGGHLFVEGTLGKLYDLHEAYANFKIEITGGETLALRELRRRDAEKRAKKE